MPAFWLALLLAAPDAGTARVLFAGDVTLGFHYQEFSDEQIAKGVTRESALVRGFDQVRELTQKADLFVVNLECPFTEKGAKLTKNFNFRARPELVAALASGGVDLVSLANNHLMDYGEEGLLDTLATLDAAKIAHFGAGRSLANARESAVVNVNGLRLAFIGYFFLGDRNIEPPEVIATEKTSGVAGHHDDLNALRAMLETDLREAKTKADLVIPFFHWGREGKTQPESYQIELAHFAIDHGAAAVIGSHPHVLQGIEMYRGAPIVYSLGNFVFGGNWDPKDKKTALVELKISRRGVEGLEIIPAFSDRYPTVPAQPYLAQGAERDEVLRHLARISAPLGGLPAALRPYTSAPDAGL